METRVVFIAFGTEPVRKLTLVRNKRRCRQCGSSVPTGVKFCTNCGQPLSLRRA